MFIQSTSLSGAELGNLVWKCESYPIQMPFKYDWNVAKYMNAFYFPEGGTIILDFSWWVWRFCFLNEQTLEKNIYWIHMIGKKNLWKYI